MEIFALSTGEFVQAAFFASEDIDSLLVRFAQEMWVFVGGDRLSHDDVGGIWGRDIGGGGFVFGVIVCSRRDWDSGFFASRAVIDFDPALVEPEFDFFVAGLVRRRLLQEVDFDLFASVEITNHNIT